MEFKILTLNDKLEWNNLLSEIPNSDVYFSPEYLELASWNNEGNPFCATFKQKGRVLLYPFLLNSIKNNYKDIQSGYGYGGIISNFTSNSFIANFFKHFEDWCNKENIIAEFIRFNPILNNHILCEGYADVILNRKTVLLSLEDSFENIWKQYDSKCRNIIRKTKKEGFKVKRLELSEKNIFAFHKLYQKTMLNVGAKEYYFFSKEYFLKMVDLLKGRVKIYGVHSDEQLIAASLFLNSSSIVNYHLSARDLKFKKFGLVYSILNEAIKDSVQNGYQTFHFGGGNSLDENDSLYKFKKSFSKQTGNFYIGTKVHDKDQYDLFIKEWDVENYNIQQNFSNIFLKYRV